MDRTVAIGIQDFSQTTPVRKNAWIIKVPEGLPNLLRVFSEGLA